MRTIAYTRSPLVNWYELTNEEREQIISIYGDSDDCDTFVIDPMNTDEFIPLSQFLRLDSSKVWDGYHSTSYFSAYFIKINKTGEQATVAYKVA